MTKLNPGESLKLVPEEPSKSEDPSKLTWVIRTSALRGRGRAGFETENPIRLVVPNANGDKETVLVRMNVRVSSNGTLRWSICLPKNSFAVLARWVGPIQPKLRISHSTWTQKDEFRGDYKLWSVADHTEQDQIELNMQIRLYTPPGGLPECPGRFIMRRMLGKGGFGEVWEVEDTETGSNDFLAKLSSKPGSHDISVETQTLRTLASDSGGRMPGFPEVMGAFKHDDGRDMMIVQRLQRNLQNILLDPELVKERKFSAEDVIEVGLQLIDRLEHMHRMGYVHRDIKDENIMISGEEKYEDVIFLIDMGLAKLFCVDGLHIAQYSNEDEDIRGLSGTELLASRDAHLGPCARRSDMENAFFALVKMYAGRLPWSDVREVGFEGQAVMFQRKGDLEAIRVFAQTKLGAPAKVKLGQALVEGLTHIRQLAFDEIPDYGMLRGLLIKCVPVEAPPPPMDVARDGSAASNVSTASGKFCWSRNADAEISPNTAAEALDQFGDLPNLPRFGPRMTPIAEFPPNPTSGVATSQPSCRRYSARSAAHDSVALSSSGSYQGPYLPTGKRAWQAPHGAAVHAAMTCPKGHELRKFSPDSSCWCRECQLPVTAASKVYECGSCLGPKAKYNLCHPCAAAAWEPSLKRGLVEKIVEFMGLDEAEKWAGTPPPEFYAALPGLLELPESVSKSPKWKGAKSARMPKSAVHMVMRRLMAKNRSKGDGKGQGYSSSSTS